MTTKRSIRPALHAARLFCRPLMAPLTLSRGMATVKSKAKPGAAAPRTTAGKILKPWTTPSYGRFGLDPNLPQREKALPFPRRSLQEFEEAAKTVSLGSYTVPELYRIHGAFHQAIKQACITGSKSWEDDFFAESKTTPAGLVTAAFVAQRVNRGRVSFNEYYVYLCMSDTAGEHLPYTAISLCLHLLEMNDWENAQKMFPRAVPRIRKMASEKLEPDRMTALGLVNARDGRENEAIANLEMARRLAVDSGADFQTEASCALELGKLLYKKGKRDDALLVLNDALKYDTPEICYVMANVTGKADDAYYRLLMGKAAASGYVPAMKALAALETEAYEQALAKGDKTSGDHLAEALEWQNLVKGFEARGDDVLRHF